MNKVPKKEKKKGQLGITLRTTLIPKKKFNN